MVAFNGDNTDIRPSSGIFRDKEQTIVASASGYRADMLEELGGPTAVLGCRDKPEYGLVSLSCGLLRGLGLVIFEAPLDGDDCGIAHVTVVGDKEVNDVRQEMADRARWIRRPERDSVLERFQGFC